MGATANTLPRATDGGVLLFMGGGLNGLAGKLNWKRDEIASNSPAASIATYSRRFVLTADIVRDRFSSAEL
jgi:hypothetical protein